PLEGDPLLPALRSADLGSILKMRRAGQFEHYIDEEKLPSLAGQMSSEEAELKIRPICLNFWLLSLGRMEGLPLEHKCRAE
ncbi:MAG: hypothetical protein ACREDR_21805, partial [Blastocatellia bacterium]